MRRITLSNWSKGRPGRARVAVLARPYRARRPQETLFHRVVRDHLETFFEYARETYDAPITTSKRACASTPKATSRAST